MKKKYAKLSNVKKCSMVRTASIGRPTSIRATYIVKPALPRRKSTAG